MKPVVTSPAAFQSIGVAAPSKLMIAAVARGLQRGPHALGAGDEHVAGRSRDLDQLVADGRAVDGARGLGGERDRDHRVVGLAHEGERGQAAVLGLVGGVPRRRRRVVGVAAGRGADGALEVLGAELVDQVLALVAVGEDEAREDVVLDRLAEEDLGLGEAHRDEHLRAAARGLLQLGEVARLAVRVVGGERDGAAEVGGEDLREALPPRVVAEDHADVGVALALHELGEHDALHGVGARRAEQVAVVVRLGERGRGRRGRDVRDAAGRGDAVGHRERRRAGQRPDDRMHALDVDEAARLLDGLRRVDAGVAGDEGHVLAEHAAGLVDVLDGEFDAALHVGAVLGERAGEVGEVADLERLAGRFGGRIRVRRGGRVVVIVVAAGGEERGGGEDGGEQQQGLAQPHARGSGAECLLHRFPSVGRACGDDPLGARDKASRVRV